MTHAPIPSYTFPVTKKENHPTRPCHCMTTFRESMNTYTTRFSRVHPGHSNHSRYRDSHTKRHSPPEASSRYYHNQERHGNQPESIKAPQSRCRHRSQVLQNNSSHPTRTILQDTTAARQLSANATANPGRNVKQSVQGKTPRRDTTYLLSPMQICEQARHTAVQQA